MFRKRFIYAIPVLFCIPLMFAAGYILRHLSLGTIDLIKTYNPIVIALIIWFLYALKSLSVFFPILVLFALSGYLFDPIVAFLVNLLGLVIELSIPFKVGNYLGQPIIIDLKHRYPKFKDFIEKQQGDTWFLSFFLRVISCLPTDLVSVYFGATNSKFYPFLFGGLLGSLPVLLTATWLGNAIAEPFTPQFYFSIAITLVVASSSLIIHLIQKKKNGH